MKKVTPVEMPLKEVKNHFFFAILSWELFKKIGLWEYIGKADRPAICDFAVVKEKKVAINKSLRI